MACRLYQSVGPSNVDFDINKKVIREVDNNQYNAIGEDGSVASVTFGYAAEVITITAINVTATVIAAIRTFLYANKGTTFAYYEIQGVSSPQTVRWMENKFSYVRNHHDNYTAKIKLRVEMS